MMDTVSCTLDWVVIGAGPAGIAALGKLIDQGIPVQKIGWIDPYFTVGDLGRKWRHVPSNTSVELFLKFLNACHAFEFKNRSSKFYLEKLDLKETCALKHIVDPLQWVSDHLKKRVHAYEAVALGISLLQGRWQIKTQAKPLYAKNVILAIGSECKTLSIAGPELISLDTALDPEKLKEAVAPQDTVAVFGSSHSAVLVLANLVELNIKKVINFYRSPHKYAVFLEDWILFDETGLKGFSAKWAKQYLDGNPPSNFERVLTSDHTFQEACSLCNKAVYAVGFERRKLPVLEQYERLHYDDRTGIIAPGLFGVGLAFPQAKFNPLGHLDFRVGLWKFMDYLNGIMPIWIKYANH